MALVEHAYLEALALSQMHKPVIVALAKALSNEKTLDGSQIDLVIARALAAEAIKAEHERRRQWSRAEDGAATFRHFLA